MSDRGRVVVVGAGPNGLSAAIVSAQAGFRVEVFEAQEQAGGGARTMELTLPGFKHDFGSAVHPMAVGSPFFQSLPLAQHGLQWVDPPAALAHPLDDGSAVILVRDLEETERRLGRDGKTWRGLMEPFASRWDEFAPEILQPLFRVPRHPWLLASFGMRALLPARAMANFYFRDGRTKALFAGCAAHSFLALEEPLSAAVGMIMGITAHAVGWPIPRGGAQAITDALVEHLKSLGGVVHTSRRVDELDSLGDFGFAMCDVTARQLQKLATFDGSYGKLMQRYKYGPGIFKVDYALSSPIPWKAAECAQAATVHLGGTLHEIADSERSVRAGKHAERPFILVSQPTLFDATRAPAGKHIAWAYCHVPNASDVDMLTRFEKQIERFAPGFRDCVLERRVWKTADLEAADANLVGGDINGGLANWRQFFLRPTWRQYSTPRRDVFLCASSTPPGGGVHGMCGANAARAALSRFMR